MPVQTVGRAGEKLTMSSKPSACGKDDHRPDAHQTVGRAGPRTPIPRTRLSAIVLMVVLCAHFAHARDQLAPDYEACEAALAQERMERKVERARLESELAALRRRVESELQKTSEAFGTLENPPALGARTVPLNHTVSSFTDLPLKPFIPGAAARRSLRRTPVHRTSSVGQVNAAGRVRRPRLLQSRDANGACCGRPHVICDGNVEHEPSVRALHHTLRR